MAFIRALYTTFLDALFPLSSGEAEVLSFTPEQAMAQLPRAPAYAGLTVPLENTRSIFAYKDERVSKLIWNIKYKKSHKGVAIGGYALFKELCTLIPQKNMAAGEDKPNPTFSKVTKKLSLSETDEKDVSSPSVSSISNPADLVFSQFSKVTVFPSLLKTHENDIPMTGAFPSKEKIVIVPIPITLKRRRERGYNQCELLTAEIERLDMNSLFTIQNDFLIRIHHSSRQTLKDRSDRLESAKDIFAVNEKIASQFSNATIVVIDDVITTGSTMKEATDTIKKSGFEKVYGLSLAH